jgi:hypothetical protein
MAHQGGALFEPGFDDKKFFPSPSLKAVNKKERLDGITSWPIAALTGAWYQAIF